MGLRGTGGEPTAIRCTISAVLGAISASLVWLLAGLLLATAYECTHRAREVGQNEEAWLYALAAPMLIGMPASLVLGAATGAAMALRDVSVRRAASVGSIGGAGVLLYVGYIVAAWNDTSGARLALLAALSLQVAWAAWLVVAGAITLVRTHVAS